MNLVKEPAIPERNQQKRSTASKIQSSYSLDDPNSIAKSKSPMRNDREQKLKGSKSDYRSIEQKTFRTAQTAQNNTYNEIQGDN